MTFVGSSKKVNIEVPSQQKTCMRIDFDSNLRRWFNRNLGVWRSRRQYFFEEEEVLHLEMFLKIQKFLNNDLGSVKYRFKWWTECDTDFFLKKPNYKKEGVIESTLIGHQLHRNSSYLKEVSSVSNVRQIDEHELIFESHYDGWDVLEHTRLIDEDRYRSRNIYCWNQNKLKIVENHHEMRVDSSDILIEN